MSPVVVLAIAVSSPGVSSPGSGAPKPPLFTTDVRALAEVDPELRGKSVGDAARQAATIATFRAFLARYPAGMFAREVRRVVLVTDMTWKGQSLGGLADSERRTIAVEVGSDGMFYTPGFLRRGLHHEAAHVVLYQHADRLLPWLWRSENASGFRYRHADGMEALVKNDAETAGTPRLRAQGLLNPYAASCYDEDLACVAEELLSDDAAGPEERVRALAQRYPRLGAKFAQMAAFYGWTFQGIRLPTLPEPWGAPNR